MRRALVSAIAGVGGSKTAAASGACAATAGFVYWDATDRRGGVGITRAATATATAALIVADYKISLAGLEKDSTPFFTAREQVHERSATRLLYLCERNGGLYTKAGQFISTASGMPAPYQRQLSKLQEASGTMGWDDVRGMLTAELGSRVLDDLAERKSVEDTVSSFSSSSSPAASGVAIADIAPAVVSGSGVFSEFDREPIAAASLAQVHRAVTAAGEEVAVKVQRPGLRRQFDVDLTTMNFITSAVLLAFPRFDFCFLVPEFRDRLARELDFTWEGRSCERTGRALADDPRMVTPKIHWSLTTGKVLTMEYVRGVKVDDGPGLRAAGIDPAAAAEALADTFARMLTCHGFVHGDPHPGNMLVRRQPPTNKKRLSSWWAGIIGGEGRRRDGFREGRTHDLGADVVVESGDGGGGGWFGWLGWLLGFGRFGGSGGEREVQIVLLDHGLYTELDEEQRRRMCRLWHAVALRDPARVSDVSEEMGVPKHLRWVLPQLMARQTSNVSSNYGGGVNGAAGGSIGNGNGNGGGGKRISVAAAAERVDGLIRGGRPPLSMDQVSEFGRALPREMMVVMRANALIRNITRKLAVDIERHETDVRARGWMRRFLGGGGGEEGGKGGAGRGFLGLSLGGFVGGDVGRRMDRRRQWAMARYSSLGVMLPVSLSEGASGVNGGMRSLSLTRYAAWRVSTARVFARMWLFRFMQYGVMLAIRTLPPGLSEPVVQRFTDMLVKARGGLPAA